MNFYIDSSALVKLYIEEVGSERMRSIIFADKNNLFISKITGAEVAAAFSRRKRIGTYQMSSKTHNVLRTEEF